MLTLAHCFRFLCANRRGQACCKRRPQASADALFTDGKVILLLKKLKKIYNAVSVILLVLAVALVILLAGVRLVGLQPYTVLSGSMQPKYPVGSLIYVTQVDPADLRVGDAVTFRSGGNVVTHEIVEVIEGTSPSERRFVTQGLTNNISDGQITISDIIGKPVFCIPYLGYVSAYVQNPSGMIGIACIAVVLLILSLIFDSLNPDKRRSKDLPNPSVLSDGSNDPVEPSEDNIEIKSQEEKQ